VRRRLLGGDGNRSSAGGVSSFRVRPVATEAATADSIGSSDLELVERHLHGDRGAFDELYQRTVHRVFGLALRLSGDREDAAELTQEVYVRVFRHLERFRGQSSLETWIFRVTLNHCRSRLGRRRLPVQSLDGPAEADAETASAEPVDPARDPEQQASAGETRRRVAAALAELPLTFREAVVLRDLEGLDYAEIATLLGVPIGTVRSRIARGRDQLRQIFARSVGGSER
jgi:RNA polymerase sigma-70 factor (ECF subfamily)